LSELNEPGFTGHPLYVLVDNLVFLWEALWMGLNLFCWIMQMLAGL